MKTPASPTSRTEPTLTWTGGERGCAAAGLATPNPPNPGGELSPPAAGRDGLAVGPPALPAAGLPPVLGGCAGELAGLPAAGLAAGALGAVALGPPQARAAMATSNRRGGPGPGHKRRGGLDGPPVFHAEGPPGGRVAS